jgi:SseB protein N-terminal domain
VPISRPSGDTGEADPAVEEALGAYARGSGSEHDALTAIAGSRLLVPVVAVLTETTEAGTEKESEMALPTLIGNDGRAAVIAFTGAESLRRWRADARPVPVPAPQVCEAAVTEADALVIDVAGPVPLIVEGARLRAIAASQPPPSPHDDPDVRAAVAAVTSRFMLKPGEQGTDLLVILETADPAEARQAAEQIAMALSARLRRGIAFRTQKQQPLLSRTNRADSCCLSTLRFSRLAGIGFEA